MNSLLYQQGMRRREASQQAVQSVHDQSLRQLFNAGGEVRQWLEVPYSQKDAAKAAGARFDNAVKLWYVPALVPLRNFKPEWFPSHLREELIRVGVLINA